MKRTGYSIALETLRKNPRATYAEVAARGRRSRVKVWQINFGRALKALGLVWKRGRKARGLRAKG